MIDLGNRGFLQGLNETAKKHEREVPNPDWKNAYRELSMAADRLDAMIARSTVYASDVDPLAKKTA